MGAQWEEDSTPPGVGNHTGLAYLLSAVAAVQREEELLAARVEAENGANANGGEESEDESISKMTKEEAEEFEIVNAFTSKVVEKRIRVEREREEVRKRRIRVQKVLKRAEVSRWLRPFCTSIRRESSGGNDCTTADSANRNCKTVVDSASHSHETVVDSANRSYKTAFGSADRSFKTGTGQTKVKARQTRNGDGVWTFAPCSRSQPRSRYRRYARIQCPVRHHPNSDGPSAHPAGICHVTTHRTGSKRIRTNCTGTHRTSTGTQRAWAHRTGAHWPSA
ncbi:hypothetical protein HK104_003305 [Borealophlyctis nickersoniae]|nr:hypothetical protein HK104_003305 [Borealophlyctis nickersoniae]